MKENTSKETETETTAAPKNPATEQTPKGAQRYLVTLVGKTPIKFDHMPQDTIENALIRGQRPPVDKTRPFVDIAREKLYIGDDGKVGIPAEVLMACLREGGRKVPYDSKSKITGGNGSLLFGFLTVEEFFIPLAEGLTKEDVGDKGSGKKIEIDISRGQMENGTTVGIIRPMIKKWTLQFHVVVDYADEPISPATIRSVFKKAGKVFGLCSHRPQKNGPFGQFDLKDLKPVEMALDETEAQAA